MRLFDWLDERTGFRAEIQRRRDASIPGGASAAHVWRNVFGLTLLVEFVTGVLLMTVYAPSATNAWSSVMYVQYQMSSGWLIRGLHHFGSDTLVVLVTIYLGQIMIYGSYKKPRDLGWLTGVGLMVLTVLLAQTGRILPWDQNGFWSAKVVASTAGSLPLIGQWAESMFVGGAQLGHRTLTNSYAAHVAILPALMMMMMAVHRVQARKYGLAARPGADEQTSEPYFPKQAAMDIIASLVALGLLFWAAVHFHGAPLAGPADFSVDFPARPEWFFVPIFVLRKFVPGHLDWIAAAALPGLVIGYVAILPFIDRTETRALGPRLKFLAPLGLIGLASGLLIYYSYSTDAADSGMAKASAKAKIRAARAIELAKEGVPPEGPIAMLARDPQTAGPVLFEKLCASCHRLGDMGPEEGKDTAPDLTDFGTEAWVLRVLATPDADNMFGRTPFKGMMPSSTQKPKDEEEAEYFTPMKKEDQKAVADFLVAQAHGKADKGSKGESIIQTRCTSCHRLDGETDDDESLAPELRGWASRTWIEWQIRNPESGKAYPKGSMDPELKGHMPAFGKQISDEQIRLLAQWMSDRITKPAK